MIANTGHNTPLFVIVWTHQETGEVKAVFGPFTDKSKTTELAMAQARDLCVEDEYAMCDGGDGAVVMDGDRVADSLTVMEIEENNDVWATEEESTACSR
jgi:hypothetical protein